METNWGSIFDLVVRRWHLKTIKLSIEFWKNENEQLFESHNAWGSSLVLKEFTFQFHQGNLMDRKNFKKHCAWLAWGA